MPSRLTRIRRADEALALIEVIDSAGLLQVALATAALNNRDANTAVERWLYRRVRGYGSWREAKPIIWAERKRLRRTRCSIAVD